VAQFCPAPFCVTSRGALSVVTFSENIRLVIWDLDETLWQGTLEEGDVVVPNSVSDIVITLAKRGIISSLCSKNDINAVKARLEREDLWKWFVFPTFAFTSKSNLIGPQIEQMGLRPQTVLFIDDSSLNRAEVAERVPGITVTSPEIIPALLEHPKFQGKDDSTLSRLGQYKILEQRQSVIANSESPDEFLRNCDITISFHTDIDRQFPRIQELVNRTNQLNFTKERWDEDVGVARKNYFETVGKSHTRHACYVKVRDKFGYYGICGFYEITLPYRAMHFVFSCRVLNMGVEQFIYQRLRFPHVKIEQPCAGRLEKRNSVDWITVVDDAELPDRLAAIPQSDIKICLRGPCEIMQSAHYLRPYFETLEEFQFPKNGWGIYPSLVRYLVLADEIRDHKISRPEELGLPADFGGFDFSTLSSEFISGNADVGIFSFSMDTIVSCYRHRSTGLIIPMGIEWFISADMTKLSLDTVKAKKPHLDAEHFEAFRNQFDYYGPFDVELFRADLVKLGAKLERVGKPFIVVEPFDDLAKLDGEKYRTNLLINQIVRECLSPLAPLVRFIRFSECVESADEQLEENHFQRRVYVRLADVLRQEIALGLDDMAARYVAAPLPLRPTAIELT
jgi:FkbH-like protein